MVQEFRDFVLRGNIIELAVAFVLGVAFAAVVGAVVNGLITPLIALVLGEPDLSSLSFTINNAVFGYGSVLTALINFAAVAAAIFFFVVRPLDALTARYWAPGEEAMPEEERRHQELLAALRER